MVESESLLLERFAGTGDGEAFAQIVRQHAGLVYGTCLRVLADADRAADATQETFFQLAKGAAGVRGSLAGWLHRVATGKAVDLIRNDSARRQREQTYVDDRANEEKTWREVSPYVDEALNGLDDETRGLLICHYLEGLSMAQIARQRGVSRPTISRQIESGLTRLRAQLQRRGVLVAAGALSSLLAQSAAQSAPTTVLQQLGKIALVGAQASPAGLAPSAVGGSLVAAATIKTVVVAVVVTAAGLIAYRTFSSGPSQGPPAPPTASRENRQDSRKAVEQPDPLEAQLTESPSPDQSMTEAADSVAASSPQPTAAQPAAQTQTPTPWWNTTQKKQDSQRPDLSTPEATVRSFTRAIVSGNAESVMACMLPGGTDYQDMLEILNADPGDPNQRSEYEMRLWLQSLDPEAEMPITSTKETDRGTEIAWQVTFKKDVIVQGQTFRAGDTFELDATVHKSGDSWLIDGI